MCFLSISVSLEKCLFKSSIFIFFFLLLIFEFFDIFCSVSYFFPVLRMHFDVCNRLILMKSSLSLFSCWCFLQCHCWEITMTNVMKVSMFPWRILEFKTLVFRSFIHFESISINGVRSVCLCMLLSACFGTYWRVFSPIQWYQHLSEWTMYMWFYF